MSMTLGRKLKVAWENIVGKPDITGLWKKGSISVETDLNDVIEYGTYTCGDSALLIHKPDGAGYGYLVVLPSGSFVSQIYVEIVNANQKQSVMYQRMRNQNGSWSVWTPINRNKRVSRSAKEYVAYGYVTTGSTELHLCVPIKDCPYMDDGQAAPVITQLVGSIRIPSGGYIGGSGYNFLTSGATFSYAYFSGGIRITGVLSSGWKTNGGTAVTNNVPVIGNITIAGTF